MKGTNPGIDSVVNSHVKGKTKDYEREWGNYAAVLRLRLKRDNAVHAVTESFFRGSNHLDKAVRLLRRLNPNHPYLLDQLVVYRGKPIDMAYEQGRFSPQAKAAYKARGKKMQALALAKQILNQAKVKS